MSETMRRAPGTQGLLPTTLPRRVLVVLGALTAVAPLVTDLYLPALPSSPGRLAPHRRWHS